MAGEVGREVGRGRVREDNEVDGVAVAVLHEPFFRACAQHAAERRRDATPRRAYVCAPCRRQFARKPRYAGKRRRRRAR